MENKRWTPINGKTTLDGITDNDHKLFRYILTRNGHNVALYGGLAAARNDWRDRSARFPADNWTVVDRFFGSRIGTCQ